MLFLRDTKVRVLLQAHRKFEFFKRFIIKNNIIPYICDECKCDDNWRGKKMPLILDHINGVRDDNRLENLRFLCSNCDSIQDTYKSKNKR